MADSLGNKLVKPLRRQRIFSADEGMNLKRCGANQLAATCCNNGNGDGILKLKRYVCPVAIFELNLL